ncbi:MAG: divalent cation tolerance protein CutA [Alphaproteobacteria bacterium]|nr:divalent cation tolerance protein CutA [Alphaproteobacteria bacterium]
MSKEVCFVYMTAASKDEAGKIGTCLVEEKLAACVNIIDGMTSIYRWEGKTENATETVLIAKTVSGNIEALTERVKALHSYDCPCIVAVPIKDGNQEFLSWINKQ